MPEQHQQSYLIDNRRDGRDETSGCGNFHTNKAYIIRSVREQWLSRHTSEPLPLALSLSCPNSIEAPRECHYLGRAGKYLFIFAPFQETLSLFES